MIETGTLVRATLVGIILQAAMYVLGHFSHWIATNVFDFGAMMISASAAYLYALGTGRGYLTGATAGAVIGGTCGFLGIALSAFLGDSRVGYIPTATTIAVFVGAVGGIFGQIAAILRAMGY
ncbi:MAG: hypothetical protein KGR48_03070 [Alphaproteobacteria bacterium]|nr:hypothetical protein [Alphaproteobacteria bacterium]MBU6474064.1 hypothetical protein [Alphaproteobacteria bacterium]MDE2013892.1 hypothetical protein [Alphaproteobacteria bacterium]MDE2073063.1 hypothetical protein [Alphaproteobacteria bacterium]MDE2351785.1 hypothetical protein [Alphaproteobacteria bacterium]